ncbi:uncharacterized protein LOC132261649 [Phlebotomus argentipes]|uniref:uncharacterized protein LOC132261649 n=1 Tax=Phlebotomus argentipes TaxID=94469 RepID=UPI002892E78A|nr:uncharacterized protein LOC132261649 [Phlebotomus argentipes]
MDRYRLMESHVKITEQLIKLVKPHPELYDMNSHLYNDRTHIDGLWASISHIMQMSTTEVRTKWNSLRSQFMRALKHERMPYGASGRRRKKWYMMDSLNFLRGVLTLPDSAESVIGGDKPAPDGMLVKRLPAFPEIPLVVMKQESQSGDSEAEVEEMQSPEKKSRIGDDRDSPVARFGEKSFPEESYASTCLFDEPPGHSGGISQAENYDQLFFQSLDKDIKRLAPHRRRRLKEIFLQTLNNLLDQQEMEQERNSVARVCQRAQN